MLTYRGPDPTFRVVPHHTGPTMTLKQYIREVRRLLGRNLTLREERYCKDAHNLYIEPEQCAKIIRETAY